MIGVQKGGNLSGNFIQRTVDDFSTLHDFSISLNKNNKWNINLIAKISTSALKIYDGDYFKDHHALGQIQGFLIHMTFLLTPVLNISQINILGNHFRLTRFRFMGFPNKK
jgi:hypothetical protein